MNAEQMREVDMNKMYTIPHMHYNKCIKQAFALQS